ncbi:putative transport protein [Vogesella perlucida]|nr:putative transport protein [Vogesella perlucida]
MADLRLFHLKASQVTELSGTASDLEKPLQTLIERNLETLLGIRFVASEYTTGKTHGGRIDTLGLDENHCPVIIEYKRSQSENVINQGLFYLDWLMDHQAEFKLLVLEKFGKTTADAIDWSGPRLICIAANFTKYDAHAVQQINRQIELVRYRLFGEDLLLLEAANTPNTQPSSPAAVPAAQSSKARSGDKSVAEIYAELSPAMVELLETVEAHIFSLGDDVQRKELKLYYAYRRLKNFATLVLQKSRLLLYLHLPPESETLPANGRDVSQVGHWGTGDIELSISNQAEFDLAKPLIIKAYER